MRTIVQIAEALGRRARVRLWTSTAFFVVVTGSREFSRELEAVGIELSVTGR